MVAKDLSTVYSEECASVVKTALSLLEEKILEENDTLGETFNLCDTKVNTNVGNDVSNLFSLMTDSFAYAAQYNNDNRNGEFNINYVCDIMTNSSFGNVLDRLAYLNADADCIDYSFESMIRELRNETLDSGVSEGGNFYMNKSTKLIVTRVCFSSPMDLPNLHRIRLLSDNERAPANIYQQNSATILH